MRYCKEHDKTVYWIDTSAITPCTLTGSFDSDYYDLKKSEWSSSTFFIQQIGDANDLGTTFTFTVAGLVATARGINGFQLNFTQPSEFDAPSKDLKIVLRASKSFGYLYSASAMAKITGNATVTNFKCGFSSPLPTPPTPSPTPPTATLTFSAPTLPNPST